MNEYVRVCVCVCVCVCVGERSHEPLVEPVSKDRECITFWAASQGVGEVEGGKGVPTPPNHPPNLSLIITLNFIKYTKK